MSETKLIFPFMAPVYETGEKYAETAVRAVAGAFLMPHGAQKLFGWFGGYGLEATGQYFDSVGFSNGYMIALSAGLVEVFAGLFLMLGLFTRVSAAAATILLLVAASTHIGQGFFWNNGGYEYALFWAVLTLYFWIKGGGHYSVDRLIGKEF